MSKYTFIIPVYNVEKYLNECVDSILSQTFTDYSIILIDDGATDGSGQICDNYANKNESVRVIHKVNGGLSSARNTGLLAAKSEYVIFLDSDDYWNDAEGLRNIDRIIGDEKVDILCFASQNYYEATGSRTDDRYNYPEEMNRLSPVEALKYQIEHDLFNLNASKRVYRREFLVKNELYYAEGIKSEDVELGIRMANFLPSYKFYNAKLYTYRHRAGSITTTIDEKHIDDYFNIIVKAADSSYVPEIYRHIMSYVAYQYSLLLAYLTLYNFNNNGQYLKKLKQYTFLLKYTEYPRTQKISRLYRILGYKLTCKLLGCYLGRR